MISYPHTRYIDVTLLKVAINTNNRNQFYGTVQIYNLDNENNTKATQI